MAAFLEFVLTIVLARKVEVNQPEEPETLYGSLQDDRTELSLEKKQKKNRKSVKKDFRLINLNCLSTQLLSDTSK